MRKLIALTVGVAALSCSAVSMNAAAAEGMYLGPSLGYYKLDDKRNSYGGDNGSFVLGMNLGYRFHNDWALEVMAGTDIMEDDMETAQLNGYWWFGDAEANRHNWRPYFVAGTSYYELEEPNLKEKFTWQVQGGFGISKLFENNWEFRMDARLAHKVREGQDGTNDIVANMMAVRYFNSAPAPIVAPVEVAPEPEVYQPEPAPEPEVRTITVQLKVEFEFDKAVVRAIYGDELEAIAKAMKVHEDIDLVLEGHTDSIGTDKYNQDLSDRRAKAVKNQLSKVYGIDPSRISAIGYGESRPIASNDTDEGRQRNRRVIGELSYTEVMPE